jgi:hypothetical protein
VAARESPSGRWVPYVRMTRPLKRPMRVALTDHLTGVQSVRGVKPSGVQLAVPSRPILLELRLRPRAAICVDALTGLGDAHLDLIKPPRLAWLWV